jgi:hypothetical protein
MTIRELQREGQERLQKAYEALKLPDTEGYTGTVEREYQKELARNLQKDGSKAANASTDQRIAGKLKTAGYSLGEIEEVIEQQSPMAVKPTQEQRQAYARSIVQKALPPRNHEYNEQSKERIIAPLTLVEIGGTRKIYGMPSEEKFFIRPKCSPQQIQSAIANLMRISIENILVYDSDDQEMPMLNNSILYLIDFTNAIGDFPCHLTIYPQLPTVDEWLSDDPERLAFISQFCALLSCEALTESDDSPDIEQGCIVLNGNGIRQEVVLDSETLINDGSFIFHSTIGENL